MQELLLERNLSDIDKTDLGNLNYIELRMDYEIIIIIVVCGFIAGFFCDCIELPINSENNELLQTEEDTYVTIKNPILEMSVPKYRR